jgi:hypothetical protein
MSASDNLNMESRRLLGIVEGFLLSMLSFLGAKPSGAL